MYLSGVLDGIRFFSTVQWFNIHFAVERSSPLCCSSFAWKSSASESRSILMSVSSKLIALIAARATMKGTKTIYGLRFAGTVVRNLRGDRGVYVYTYLYKSEQSRTESHYFYIILHTFIPTNRSIEPSLTPPPALKLFI